MNRGRVVATILPLFFFQTEGYGASNTESDSPLVCRLLHQGKRDCRLHEGGIHDRDGAMADEVNTATPHLHLTGQSERDAQFVAEEGLARLSKTLVERNVSC